MPVYFTTVVYHSVWKCNGNFIFIVLVEPSLFSGTEWYELFISWASRVEEKLGRVPRNKQKLFRRFMHSGEMLSSLCEDQELGRYGATPVCLAVALLSPLGYNGHLTKKDGRVLRYGGVYTSA